MNYDERLIEYEQRYLRALVCPHFFSNSLTGLQDLILEDREAEAIEYIAEFGRLMRLTVDHAQRDFIELDSELELLNKYIGLENLVGAKPVSFIVKSEFLGGSGPNDVYMVPAMMIQPFIENSILHGFRNEQTTDRIIRMDITFSEHMKVVICDNGIGLKNEIVKGITSTIERRLKLYEEKFHKTYGFKYSERRINDHKDCGICVELNIPYYIINKNEEKKIHIREIKGHSHR